MESPSLRSFICATDSVKYCKQNSFNVRLSIDKAMIIEQATRHHFNAFCPFPCRIFLPKMESDEEDDYGDDVVVSVSDRKVVKVRLNERLKYFPLAMLRKLIKPLLLGYRVSSVFLWGG